MPRLSFVCALALLVSTDALAGVGESGAFQTTVSIDVPAYHDLTPKVQLDYSSALGNGAVGIGWRLTAASTIRRTSSTRGAPRYDATDIYFVDGQELVPCRSVTSSPTCDNGATHAFRIETFRKVVFDEPSNTWTITDKDGTEHRYRGQLGKVTQAATTYSWAIDRVSDSLGHSVWYQYFCDADRACFPSTISYGDGFACAGNGHDQPPGTPIAGGRISFVWEQRFDFVSSATGAGFEETRYRLQRISVAHAGSLVRAYELDYVRAFDNGSSLVSRIRELGRDNHTPGPVRTFEYPSAVHVMSPVATSSTSAAGTFLLGPFVPGPGPAPQSVPPTWTAPGNVVAGGRYSFQYGDVDGDRRADVVAISIPKDCSTITVRTRLAGSTSDLVSTHTWTSHVVISGQGTTEDAHICADKMHLADLDGDGRKDLVFENWTTGLRLMLVTMLSTGGEFAPPSSEQLVNVFAGYFNYSPCTVGDVNGDGREDYICPSSSQNSIMTELSVGDGSFQEQADPGVNSNLKWGLRSMDVNGDGLDDLVATEASSALWAITTGISDGQGNYAWEPKVTTAIPIDTNASTNILAGDFDGDGHRDLVFAAQGASGTRLGLALARGTGASRWTTSTEYVVGLTKQSVLAAGDTDDDGTSELMIAWHHRNANNYCGNEHTAEHFEAWAVPLGTNTTFFSGVTAEEDRMCGPQIATNNAPQVLDVNGDGRSDWLGIEEAGGNTYTVVEQLAINRNNGKTAWRRADVNGDGREDWVSVIYGSPGLELATVITQADGSLSRLPDLRVGPSSLGEGAAADSARTWFAIDVGGPAGVPDGRTDVVVVDDRVGVITTFLAVGNGTWTTVTRNHGLAVRRTPQSWMPLDFDGDGRIDLVRLEPTTVPNSTGSWPAVSVLALHAVGDGTWTAGTPSAVFVGTRTPRLSAFRAIDLDGDGRGDLVQMDSVPLANSDLFTTTVRTLRSQSDGTFTGAVRNVPFQFHPDADHYQVADINGDGRGDLARFDFAPGLDPTIAFMYGVGDGTFTGLLVHGVTGTIRPAVGEQRSLRAADLDEDGRTDFYTVVPEVTSTGINTTTLQVIWNRAGGFKAQASPVGLSARDTPQFQLDDATSDGRPDLVRLGSTVDRILLAAPPARMSKMWSGMGALTTITYATSVGRGGNLPAGVVLPIVAQTAVTDYVRGQGVETTTYSFRDLTYDYGRRDVVGFATQESVSGRSKLVTAYQLDDRCGAQPFTIELRDAGNALISRTTNGYVPDSATGAAPFTCLVQDRTTEECEGSSTCRTTAEHTSYDAFGNVQQLWQEGDIKDATDDRIIATPIIPNLTSWIVAMPAYRSVWGQVQTNGVWSWHLDEYTVYLYDGSTDPKEEPKIGLITTQQRWNDQTGNMVESAISYDKWGNVETRTGPSTPHAPTGKVETVAYDCTFHRYPEKVCDAIGCTTATWDEALGVKLSTTDENHQITKRHYDALGRLYRIDQPDGSAARWELPDPSSPALAQHMRSMVTDGSPGDGVYWIDTFFDGLGRPWRTVQEGGRTVDTDYDGASERPLRTSNPYFAGDTPRWTQRTYDAANRLIAATTPDGRSRRTTHTVGAATMTDENFAKKIAFSDGYGRVVAVLEIVRKCFNGGDSCQADASYLTTYGYDALDREIWIRDANGNISTEQYDSLSNRLVACSPDRGCHNVEYADDGLPLAEYDANGNVHRVQYDASGRAIERTSIEPGGTVTRTTTLAWDLDPATHLPHGSSIGRLVRVDDSSNVSISRLRRYDSMGRADVQEDCISGHCLTTQVGYDLAGRLQRFTYPDGSVASYVYDERGLLVELSGYAAFAYDDATYKPTTTTYANGAVEERSYNADRQWFEQVELTAKSGKFVEAITHDGVGRVRHATTTRTSGQIDTDYSYDDLGRLRLVVSSDPALGATYDYDGIGNMIRDSQRGTIAYTNHVHAPTSTTSGQVFAYDKTGQLVKSDRREIEWNQDGNPIVIRDLVTKATTELGYDGDGALAMRTGAAGTELYFSPFVELDAGGKLVTYVLAHGEPVARRDASGTTYLHRDHLGSIRAITDDHGTIVDERDYTTWGAERSKFSLADIAQAFTGARRDADHGLVHLGSRYYDPDARVFLSADSIVPDTFAPQSLNAYAYVTNDPASLIDPTGHEGEDYWYDETDPSASSYGVGLDFTVGEAGATTPPTQTTYSTPATWPEQTSAAGGYEEGYFESVWSGRSEPSLGKSFVPVIGNMQYANYHFAHDNYARGALYTALAATDVLLVGSIGKGLFKVVTSRGVWVLGTDFVEGTRRLVTGNWRAFGETWRLLTGKAQYGLKQLFFNPRDFKLVSKQYWRGEANELGMQLQHLWSMNSTRWVPQGLRNCGLNLLEVPAAFNQWMSNGVSNVVFRTFVKTLLQGEFQAIYSGTQALLGIKDPSTPAPTPAPQGAKQ